MNPRNGESERVVRVPCCCESWPEGAKQISPGQRPGTALTTSSRAAEGATQTASGNRFVTPFQGLFGGGFGSRGVAPGWIVGPLRGEQKRPLIPFSQRSISRLRGPI